MVTEIKDVRLIQLNINPNSLQQICWVPTMCRLNNPDLSRILCRFLLYWQSQFEKEKVHWAYIHYWGMPEQEFQEGTWRQKLKQRPWRNDTYWLAFHCLLNLISYTSQDHLFRGGTAQSGLGALTSTINQEMPSLTCPLANLMKENP